MGSVELKLVYTSKLGTKTEVSKHFDADPKHIEGLLANKFFQNDPDVIEWADCVLKFERAKKTTSASKRPAEAEEVPATGTGLKRWEKQPRIKGKFVSEDEFNNLKGTY